MSALPRAVRKLDAFRSRAGLAVLLLGALCALALSGQAPLPRADFAFCNQAEVKSLDPALATGFPEGRVVAALFEGLTRPDPMSAEPLPALARSWQVSDDALTWTFRLRDDARWSNGEPVVAEDVRFGLLRLLTPATLSENGSLLRNVAGATAFWRGEKLPLDASTVAITAPDRSTLVIGLSRPEPKLPRLLAHHALVPVHRPSLEAHGKAWLQPGKLVSNGAFRLEARRLKDRLRLVRNRHYWDAEHVALSSVDAYCAEGVTTQLNLFLTGEVDWMIKPPPALNHVLLTRPEALVGPQLGTTFLRFNVLRAPLDDVRVRQALLLALDRDALATEIMGAGRPPAWSFLPADMPDSTPARMPARSLPAARKLLAQAGYPGGAGLPALELLYPNNETSRDLCQAIAETWRRELGVLSRAVVQSWKVYLDSSKQGLYHVAWSSWIADWADPLGYLEVFRSDGGSNRTGYADSAYDALLEQAAFSADVRQRAELMRRAEQLLLDAAPIAPIHQRVNINLVSQRVLGFFDNTLDLHPLRDLSVSGAAP